MRFERDFWKDFGDRVMMMWQGLLSLERGWNSRGGIGNHDAYDVREARQQ